MNKWDKFWNYLQELNWPAVEKFVPNGGFEEWRLVSYSNKVNTFNPDGYYRIAQDIHHELRLKWLVSNKQLPIEYKSTIDKEWLVVSPTWDQDGEYREAVEKHEDICTDPVEEKPYFERLADSYIALGNALKDRNTNITELTELASNCGLDIQFRIVAK